MHGLQKALWLPEAKGGFVVGAKPIQMPGAGELLVKIEAVALNSVSFVQSPARFPAICSWSCAGRMADTEVRLCKQGQKPALHSSFMF
jgi:NADPH:quinone reductase-like Zn-dependent oxidoreductase